MNVQTIGSEQVIADILAKAAGREEIAIGKDEDFCEALGLDSLDRLELLSEIEDRLGILLGDEEVRGVRTLQDLHAAVGRAVPARGGRGY